MISMTGVTRRFGDVTALDDVSFELAPDRIYGLLGRNGAGKTTLMQILTGQLLPSAGDVRVFGGDPFENPEVLAKVCFVKEGQRYPDDFKVRHVLAAARNLLPHWDAGFADQLVADFGLPLNRPVKKLSRGMTSAVGVVVGLASRAPLTLFDEPYLGLDAVARGIFYDRLLTDYAEHPRTVILSTHLIDEVADLIEHVVLVDKGRIVVNDDADVLRAQTVVVSGPARAVDAFTTGRAVLHRESLGGRVRSTVADLSEADRTTARGAGVEVSAVSLQQLVVQHTGSTATNGRASIAAMDERGRNRPSDGGTK